MQLARFCLNAADMFVLLTDLLVDMLGVLASYSITVKELKIFFSKLQGEQGQWVSRNPPGGRPGSGMQERLKAAARRNKALLRQKNTDKSAGTLHGSHGRRATRYY